MDGWLKLWRNTLMIPCICKDAETFSIWVHLLLEAKYEETPSMFNGKPIILKPGQLTIGRIQFAKEIKISESKIQRVLKMFETEHQIEQQTCNKNRLITIVNWEIIQGNGHHIEQQMNNKRTTTEQPVNTPKEVKNERKKEIRIYPEWLDVELFKDFLKMRIAIKKPATDRAETMLINKLATYKEKGYNIKEIMEQAILHNWQDFYEPKTQPKSIDAMPEGMVKIGSSTYPKYMCRQLKSGQWELKEHVYDAD